MTPLETSKNAFSTLISSEIEHGKGKSKRARKRRNQAARNRTDAAIDNGAVVNEKNVATVTLNKEGSEPVVNAPIQPKAPTALTSANAKVLRITNVDDATKSTTSNRQASHVTKQYPSPPASTKQTVSYSTIVAASQKGSSQLSPHPKSKSLTDEATGTKAVRKSSIGSASSTSSVNSKKAVKSKQKLIVGEDGWTIIPSASRNETLKSGSPTSSKLSSSNSFSALRGSEIAEPIPCAKNTEKAQMRSKDELKMESATHAGTVFKDPFAVSSQDEHGRSWADICSTSSEHTLSPKTSPVVGPKIGSIPKDTDSPAMLSSPKLETNSPRSYAKAAQSPVAQQMVSAVPFKMIQVNQKHAKPESHATNAAVSQAVANLLEMDCSQRKALLKGPRITVFMADKVITHIPKRVAMAASPILNEHFTKNPESLVYRFADDKLPDSLAVRFLLVTYPQEGAKEVKMQEVQLQNTVHKNVAILRAARFLGMERYTKGMLRYCMNYFRTYCPSYTEIEIVERMRTSGKDPLWTSMVNHLCWRRFKGDIPDPKQFATFLEGHPNLKDAMTSADEYFKGKALERRKAAEEERRQTWQEREEKREEEKKARWMKNQQEKKDRQKRNKATVASLRCKQNGVQLITAEEAAMLRRR